LIYNKIVENVEKIITFNSEIFELKIQSQKDNLIRKITYSEGEINNFVYKLYNIEPNEIENIKKYLDTTKNADVSQIE